MKASANEVMTLAAKAARGAGAPPGQASEFGRAALCHLVAERPEADLQAALEELPDGPIISLPVALAAICESAVDGVATGVLPRSPLALSYVEAQLFASDAEVREDTLCVTLDLSGPNSKAKVARVLLSEDMMQRLSALAARTFVPETAASRLSGAGAGLTDND